MKTPRFVAVWLVVLAGCSGSDVVGNGNENDNGNTNEAWCGDGVAEGAEECDDGNDSNTDACLSACSGSGDCCVVNRCGDGYVDETPVGAGWQVEACDDGNNEDGDLCRGDCGQDLTVCGNGLLDQGEACDLGGQNSDDPNAECRRDCQPSGCGDSILDDQLGEECDDGIDNSDSLPNACRTDCAAPSCGDGIADDLYGEGCDDGTGNSDTQPDACRTTCAPAACGDAVVDTGEECDETNLDGATCATFGYTAGTLSCHADCTYDQSNCHSGVCGNGIIEGTEDCDLFELGGQTCQTLGFFGGNLACSVSCTFNTADCFLPPTMPVGAPCLTPADCNGGLCLEEAGPSHFGPPGGYCYEFCDANGGCPGSGPNGVCLQFGGGASYCLEACDLANPACRPGYSCESVGGVGVCMWGFCDDDVQCTVTGDCETDSASANFGWCVSPPETCNNAVDDDFDLRVDCADPECNGDPACPVGEICGNIVDDDGDGLADCADGECNTLGLCTGEMCTPLMSASLTCGDVLTGEANDQAGSAAVINSAECVDPETALPGAYFTNEWGPEYAYVLTVIQPQEVTLTVDSFTGDLDVYVIREILGDCDAHRGCFAWGGEGAGVAEVVSFTAYPAVNYYVVVDGFQGTISPYDISVACASTGYEDCGNSIDDDGDSLVDCDDPECWGILGCTTETDCANGEDEDTDGAIDCADSDCAGAPGC